MSPQSPDYNATFYHQTIYMALALGLRVQIDSKEHGQITIQKESEKFGENCLYYHAPALFVAKSKDKQILSSERNLEDMLGTKIGVTGKTVRQLFDEASTVTLSDKNPKAIRRKQRMKDDGMEM